MIQQLSSLSEDVGTSPESMAAHPELRRAKGGCRFCSEPLRHVFVDLGLSPLCENWLTEDDLHRGETFYPLTAFVCEKCFLVQVEEYVSGEEIFGGEYGYFSSYSTTWLEHAKRYVEKVVPRFGLNEESFVVELAANDGYLLKHFVERNIPQLGIEPAANCAAEGRKLGIDMLVAFFGVETAERLKERGTSADLLIANNVLAHVPDLNDFVAGMKILLSPTGVITVEFPQLATQMAGNQFDTIYQEHYCYFSFTTVEKIFAAHGITVFDVEELTTHGGSLRVYGKHQEDASKPISDSVGRIRDQEQTAGLTDLAAYRAFADQVAETKRGLLSFLIEAKRAGKTVVGYGAPGKATTLLNYCGVRQDFVDYLVDRSPYKHGRYMPGVRLPITEPDAIRRTKPDYVLILPWNLKDEIMEQMAYIREWGAKFVVPIPAVEIYS